MKLKILLNCSSVVVGGGIQVSVNLIRRSLQNSDHTFCYVLSNKVYQNLIEEIENIEDVHIVNESPAKLLKGRKTRKYILDIEKRFQPDIVYSIGSPSYVKFKSLEIMRLTNPWILKIRKLALSNYPKLVRVKIILKTILQRRYVRADFYITQTDDAKMKINETFGVPTNRIKVISNCLPKNLESRSQKKKEQSKIHYRILSFSSPYPHKNIDLIPYVIKELKTLGYSNFTFMVTIPEGKFLNKFNRIVEELGVTEHIENMGYIKLDKVASLYEVSDILFLPTLLEVFSVTYLEAAHYGLPIVTTDLPFSRSVCRDKALYFKPKDPHSAALNLYSLMNKSSVYEEFERNSKMLIRDYQNADEIYKKHFSTLEYFYSNCKEI